MSYTSVIRTETTMIKYGRLMEYRHAAGNVAIVRTLRPTAKNCRTRGTAAFRADVADMQAKGWVLIAYTDGHGGGGWAHSGQLRDVSNDR